MRIRVRSIIRVLAIVMTLVVCGGCGTDAGEESTLPALLNGQCFVYDELETGEGTSLYTLRFTDHEYYLYAGNGIGILDHGTVQAEANKTLHFAGQIADGMYSGNAFEVPSVTVTYQGRKMRFTPVTETTEYVYLSFLGTFTGAVDGKDAVLVLERWSEWYLYTDGRLTRGSYEIYANGSIQLAALDGTVLSGTVEKGDAEQFDLRQLTIHFANGDFAYCTALEKYDAAHAMGTYTLSLYPENIFEIHGIDGFLKAIGTIQMLGDTGKVAYFPRTVTDNVEETQQYQFSVTRNEDTYYFPETTPLLPRSGNVSKETGIGAYWNAGTKLEFIRQRDKTDGIPAIELFDQILEPGSSNLPDTISGLKAVMPSTGVARPLVLLIDFPDYHRPRHVTAEEVQEALFSLDQPDSLSAFYFRSSYGKLTIDGTVYGWYRTKSNRSSYASDSEIMSEAINYFLQNEGLRLADFDADNDGIVDSLYVLWAGNMENDSGIWDSAYRATWSDSPAQWDRKITGYIFVPGTTIWSSVPPLICNTNSLVHETGHLLGLNDYYSYDTSERRGYDGAVFTGGALEGGLGGMDMMDTNIGDHNVFSKWLLGWAEPTVIEYENISSLTGEAVYRIRPSALAGDAIFIKLRSADSLYTELLVIESVAPVLNAAEYSRLSGPVVRVMHIENSLAQTNDIGAWRGFGFRYDNSYTSTKYISILEADGKDEVLNFIPSGSNKISYEMTDYFTAGGSITPDTYPNTNAYDVYGNASVPTGLCIYIEEIEEDGTAVIRLSYSRPKDSLELTQIYPAPQVVPYKRGETKTVPAKDTKLTFTFNAELAWAENGAESRIIVLCDHKPIEGVGVKLEDNCLVITFDPGLEAGRAYTVVIPANLLAAANASDCRNNFNGIYSFITE